MTRRPRWDDRATWFPSASGSVKSGAGSPGDRRTGAAAVSVMTTILPRSAGRVAQGEGQPGSAGQEGEPDVPLMVVGIGVDQADPLPDAEHETALEHRHARVRRHERRQDVVAAVPGTAMPVPPPVVT